MVNRGSSDYTTIGMSLVSSHNDQLELWIEVIKIDFAS